ncbi:MAG: hypothetical protein JWL60_1440 [Gemmatimonadetes bacterium]|jgi:hypothetical protein|nr:hypothetical protein [Gemmatimonadota bacterium]
MFGRAVVAGILTAAIGCDKQASSMPAPKRTSMVGKPMTLFLLFGERSDPRLLPLATIAGARITPISLDEEGWRGFDSTYFAPGAGVSVYRDGAALPAAVVRRGMWGDDGALYSLPGCRSLRPLGAVTMGDGGGSATIELLATSAPLATAAARAAATPADADSARAFADRAAQRAGLTKSARDAMELVPRAIHTGATDRPTLVVAYVEKGGGTPRPRHVFAMADVGMDGYSTTYSHSVSDSLPELRRLIDHVDLTGDGVDEVVLEATPQGGQSYLVVMQFVGGRWKEAARGTSSWCADR